MREKENKVLGNLYEWILCAFIIIAPINNALNDLGIYAMTLYVSIAVLISGLACKLIGYHKGNLSQYAAIIIAGALLFEMFWWRMEGKEVQMSLIYILLIYCVFLTLPAEINLKRIYCAFYVSTLVGALFSMYLGITQGGVTRTATSVDGSLAVIGMAIILFAPEDFEVTSKYKLLKIMSFAACLIIAGFGMSRARIVLIALALLVKLLFSGGTVLVSGRVNATVLLSIPFLLVLVLVIIRLYTVGRVVPAVEDRFVDGFESAVRDREIDAGWNGFQSSWLRGRGWGELIYRHNAVYRIYYNHCMYVAILTRGGILLGIPMLISFLWLIYDALRTKNHFVIVTLAMFFLLGYGNAGVFNYTICSMFIPLIPCLKQQIREFNEKKLYQQRQMADDLMQARATGNGEETI